MNLKGDLDSISLAELFQTLSSQRATGVLTIGSPNGEKTIGISSGEIAVISDKLGERTRLGDLLVARGRLSEAQLLDALKIQREREQRTKLGDLLIKLGLIKAEDIAASLRFQLEEELCDLFTWKGAKFEFDGERSLEDACAEGAGDATIQRLTIEPQAVIAEASRRMSDWKTIESRLPTPYLCFKPTPKGDELAAKANPGTLVVYRLLKEGRTIETTVKRSCAGRFNVCRAVVKMMDEGWIVPYPATELRTLAAEHRAHHRYADALYIYRRQLDATSRDEDRQELEVLIADTLETIRKAQEAGEFAEGIETVSYKDAAARYRRRQTFKRAAALLFCGGALIAATVVLTQAYRPPPSFAEKYREALQAADDAVHKQRYEEAAEIWRRFHATMIRDPNSDTAKQVRERIDSLSLDSLAQLDGVLKTIEAEERAGRLDEAEQRYYALMEQNDQSPLAQRMKDGLARIAERRRENALTKARNELKDRIEKAQTLRQERKFGPAREAFQELARTTAAGSPERRIADEALRDLAAIETRSRKALDTATREVGERKAEQAIASFETATAEWPELPSAETARREAQRLRDRLERARQELAAADNLAAQGVVLEAIDAYRRVEREYAEFELRQAATERAGVLQGKADAVDQRIAAAKAAFAKDKDEGRRLYMQLMREAAAFLAARKTEVPVQITSYPSGAEVVVNGRPAGTTPLDAMVPAAKPFALRVVLPGYDSSEQQMPRLVPEDKLQLHVNLSRAALYTLELKTPVFAPPRILGGVLYVLHGAALSAFDPDGKALRWTVTDLFDEKAQTRPNSDGAGLPVFVDDKSWWCPRWPPEENSPGKLLLPLRSRDLVEIDTAAHRATKLVSLPVEPVGRAHFEPTSLMGKPLLAVGCADGKVRCFDLTRPALPKWERPADPATPPPRGALAAGLASRPGGTFVALTVSGRMTGFNTVDGTETWSLQLSGLLAPANALPATSAESLAAIVHADGRVTAVDLGLRAKVWELAVNEAMSEASHAVVGSDGVYVITRQGTVCKYPRAPASGAPAALWRKPLDGGTETPLAAGKYVYAVSTFGTIYALSLADGAERWKYRIAGTPTGMSEHNGLLYVGTKEGHVLILKTE